MFSKVGLCAFRRWFAAALLVVAAAAMCQVAAQRHYKPHIHVGAHGGVSLSSMDFFPSVQDRLLEGAQMGVAFRYAEERHVGLMAEINLEQRGWREDFKGGKKPGTDVLLAYQHRITYVELPIMTHIFFGSKVVKCFFNLGPEIGYAISDKISSNFDYANARPLPGTPFENRQTVQMGMKITNRFDYGITAGAGAEFILKRRHSIMLEGRYYYGLGNIFPASKKDEFSASRGSSILVTLGYMFRIK